MYQILHAYFYNNELRSFRIRFVSLMMLCYSGKTCLVCV